MERVKFNVIKFIDNDVIATSGLTLTVANTFNGTNNDAVFYFNGKSYNSSQIMSDRTIAESYFGDKVYDARFFNANGTRIGGNQLFALANNDATKDGDYLFDERTSDDYNNTYVYKNNQFYIQQ